MIDLKNIDEVMVEVDRFRAACKALRVAARHEDLRSCPKARGRVLRASMDLTRALADLRRAS